MVKYILTKREKEVFKLLVTNKDTKEIAEILNISEKTVRNHISNAMQKLGVKGRAQAVVELIKMNIIVGLALKVFAGIVVYLALSIIFKVEEFKTILGFVKSKLHV